MMRGDARALENEERPFLRPAARDEGTAGKDDSGDRGC